MILAFLNKYRNIFPGFLIPLLLVSVLNPLDGNSNAFQSRQGGEKVLSEVISNNFFSGSLSFNEKKLNSLSEILILAKSKTHNIEIVRSTAYLSCINNNTITNFRLHTFLTSHFATST